MMPAESAVSTMIGNHRHQLGPMSRAELRRELAERFSATTRELALSVAAGPPILECDSRRVGELSLAFFDIAAILDGLWHLAPPRLREAS